MEISPFPTFLVGYLVDMATAKKSTAKSPAGKATDTAPDTPVGAKTDTGAEVLTPDEALTDEGMLARAADQPTPHMTAPVPAPTDELAGKPTIAIPNSEGVPVPVRFDPVDDALGLAPDIGDGDDSEKPLAKGRTRILSVDDNNNHVHHEGRFYNLSPDQPLEVDQSVADALIGRNAARNA